MSKGYGKAKGIKIMHWNKGSKFLINQIHDVQTVLNENKPHVLAMSEAQVRIEDMDEIQFDDYVLEVDNLIYTNKMARLCMLIHTDIKYERLKALEP